MIVFDRVSVRYADAAAPTLLDVDLTGRLEVRVAPIRRDEAS